MTSSDHPNDPDEVKSTKFPSAILNGLLRGLDNLFGDRETRRSLVNLPASEVIQQAVTMLDKRGNHESAKYLQAFVTVMRQATIVEAEAEDTPPENEHLLDDWSSVRNNTKPEDINVAVKVMVNYTHRLEDGKVKQMLEMLVWLMSLDAKEATARLQKDSSGSPKP